MSGQEPARLVAERCVRCHNPEKKKGGVDLTPLTKTDFAAQRKLLRRVLEQIESRAMPPAEQPPLTDAERLAVVRWGRQGLAKSEPADPALRDPGPALVRRLNRTEYNRTLPLISSAWSSTSPARPGCPTTARPCLRQLRGGFQRLAGAD